MWIVTLCVIYFIFWGLEFISILFFSPGDLVIMKVVTSGVGFVPLANSPGTDRDDPRIRSQTLFNSGDASYRLV